VEQFCYPTILLINKLLSRYGQHFRQTRMTRFLAA
jgi:hypothetical protein